MWPAEEGASLLTQLHTANLSAVQGTLPNSLGGCLILGGWQEAEGAVLQKHRLNQQLGDFLRD